ncbi:hypothetical protein BH23ACT10_BH23ACT10_23400 [soil metagenome]
MSTARRASRPRLLITLLAALGLLMTLTAPASAGPKTFTADLSPLNGSGVNGTATLTAEGSTLTVHIEASGLEAGMLHPQHIHGFDNPSRNAVCPTQDDADELEGLPEEADDPDKFVALEEGLDDYGPVQLPLEPFPTAEDGTIDYTQTFPINSVKAVRGQLQNRHIVLHGLTIPGDDGDVYVATLPVACGQIVAN